MVRYLLLLLPVLASCTSPLANQGPLQPQALNGPCGVQRFFVVGQRSVPVAVNVRNTGEACSFVLFDPNLQLMLNAAFITTPAQHGVATAELVNGRRQVAITYVPQPGYAGPDRFAATWEPGGTGVTLNVTVAR